MATNIPQGSTLLLTSPSDGEAITGRGLRFGMMAGAVVGALAKLGRRGGIIPARGNPGEVTVNSTTSVLVKAGQFVVPAANGLGVHHVTLTTDTVIDTITGDGTNPRMDVIVVEVISDDATGAGTSCQIKRVAGTASASPARPTLTPPANGQYLPLRQIRVAASGAPAITLQPLGDTDSPWTVAPGGDVPVSSQADASAMLPDRSRYSLPGGEPGRMVGTAAYVVGMGMYRSLDANPVVTDGSGDFTINLAVYLNGVLTPSSFANACLGTHLMDATASGTYNGPVWFKRQSMNGSNVTFRAYNYNGSTVQVMTGATLAVSGFAWGW